MEIKSKDFGILEIDQKDIIHFVDGLFAFEEDKDYVLIEKDGYKQKWLQSTAGETPRFIVFDPDDIVSGYKPELLPDVLESVDMTTGQSPDLYVIAVIPENIKDMTVNLKSPIVLNGKKNLAVQVILEKENYPIRYPVFRGSKEGA